MASQSAHFNLTKPATTDYYDVAVVNANTDIIDTQMYNNQVSAAKIMVGASADEDGESGRVPAPSAGDEDKYLKADGTWGTPSGGGGGSTVIPNPTGTPTDTLDTVSIDGTIYEIQGAGGGSSAEEMTLAEYNALTTEEKNDGTIRFIPESSVGTTNPIDMSNPTDISEGSNIVITPSEESVEITWDTSASSGIAATFYYSRIDVTNYDYLVYDLVTGDSYDSLHPGSENPIRDLGIGLCSSAPSTWAYAPNVNWTVWNRYGVTDTNKNLGTQTLDVSELSGEYYLVIAGVAWEATISNLKYATSGGNPSQIKYMGKTYADGTGGGSSSHTYSTTEQIVGTWIDGSIVYEKSYEITLPSDYDASNAWIVEADGSFIESILSFEGTIKTSGGMIMSAGSNAPGWHFTLHRNGNNQLVLQSGNGDVLMNGTAYVTIRYTKVSTS